MVGKLGLLHRGVVDVAPADEMCWKREHIQFEYLTFSRSVTMSLRSVAGPQPWLIGSVRALAGAAIAILLATEAQAQVRVFREAPPEMDSARLTASQNAATRQSASLVIVLVDDASVDVGTQAVLWRRALGTPQNIAMVPRRALNAETIISVQAAAASMRRRVGDDLQWDMRMNITDVGGMRELEPAARARGAAIERRLRAAPKENVSGVGAFPSVEVRLNPVGSARSTQP